MLSPPIKKHFVLMNVTVFETQPYFSLTQPLLQGESSSEEGLLNQLTVPTLMLEHEKQKITNESLNEPTDESYASHVEELRVYSKR
jgi:hypothetical protein